MLGPLLQADLYCTHQSMNRCQAQCDVMEFIKNVCDRSHICTRISEYAYEYYLRLKLLLAASFTMEETAAFAIFESCNRHDSPRSSEEICQHSGVATSRLFKLENSLNINTSNTSAKHFLERFCGNLDLDFTDEVQIGRVLGNNLYALRRMQPNCLVAAVIYFHCIVNNVNKSLKEICEACNVSTGNTRRIAGLIREPYYGEGFKSKMENDFV